VMWNGARMIKMAFKILGIALAGGFVAGLVAGVALAFT
jgi:hypothetical protein